MNTEHAMDISTIYIRLERAKEKKHQNEKACMTSYSHTHFSISIVQRYIAFALVKYKNEKKKAKNIFSE